MPEEVLNKIKDKSITQDIYRIQDNESVMCGFYCIALASTFTSCVSIFACTSSFCVPVGITSSTVGTIGQLSRKRRKNIK